MYDDMLDEFSEMLDNLLSGQVRDMASFKVGKALYDQLVRLAEDEDQARFLFANIRVAVSEDIYKGNELHIEGLVEKFARYVVHSYLEHVFTFGEYVAQAVFTKGDLHFTLET